MTNELDQIKKEYASLIVITVNEINRSPKVKGILLAQGQDSEFANKLIQAYMLAAIERFKTFATKYRTEQDFARCIQDLILETL